MPAAGLSAEALSAHRRKPRIDAGRCDRCIPESPCKRGVLRRRCELGFPRDSSYPAEADWAVVAAGSHPSGRGLQCGPSPLGSAVENESDERVQELKGSHVAPQIGGCEAGMAAYCRDRRACSTQTAVQFDEEQRVGELAGRIALRPVIGSLGMEIIPVDVRRSDRKSVV